jgi:ABC-type nitrate/sulfonate/bicarbonate transport system substrate-binding protein
MRWSRTWLSVALVCLLAVAGVAGCGDDEAESGGGAATGEPEVAKVRWGQAVYSAAYWGIYAGQQQGFFEDEAIDLSISIVPSSPSLVAAAQGGSLDMFATAGDAAVAAIASGADVQLIGGIQRVSALQFVAKEGAQSASDLAGATIGATNLTASDALFARLYLENNGLSKDDFSLIAVGTFPDRAAALSNGQIQGAMMTEPWLSELEKAGLSVLGGADESVGTNYNFINVATRKSWAEENRDVVVRFLRGYGKAVEWLNDPANEEAAITLLTAEPAEIPREQAQAAYDRFIAGDDDVLSAELTEEDVATAIRLTREENVPDAPEDPATYADLSFWQEASGG